MPQPAMPQLDAILIPGGGVRAGGGLPSWVRRRLDLAIERHNGEYMIPLSAGTPHRPPPLNASGFPIYESVAAARYLMDAGIPADRILTECTSHETIGNAYFSRVIHVDPQGFRRLLVITSDFHMRRTEAAFKWVYALEPRPLEYELSFEGVADPEMDEYVFHARVEKELESVENMRRIAAGVTSLAAFHRWLFTEHGAYNAERKAFIADQAAGPILQSY